MLCDRTEVNFGSFSCRGEGKFADIARGENFANFWVLSAYDFDLVCKVKLSKPKIFRSIAGKKL